eukprot:s242_g34.t1
MHQSTPDKKDGMAESTAYQEEEAAFGSSPEPVYCHPNIPDDRMNEAPTWTLEVPGTTQPDEPSGEFDSVWWEPSQATDFNPFEGLEGVPRPGFPRTSQRSLSNQSSCLGGGRSSSPQAEHGFYNPGEPVSEVCQVQVEQKYVGYILGVSGRTIRKIAKENEVKMFFDQSTCEQGYSTLNIAGTPAAVEGAKAVSEFKVSEQYGLAIGRAYESSVVVQLEPAVVGMIIGPKGQTVQRLEREFNVKINIKNSLSYQGFSKLCILGDADSAKQAEARILQIAKGWCGSRGETHQAQRGRLRECASETSYSSRAASLASSNGSDCGPGSGQDDFGNQQGAGVGQDGNKTQSQSQNPRGRRWLPWAPTAYLRSKMQHLLGRWYCNERCYEVCVDHWGCLKCTSWCIDDMSKDAGEAGEARKAGNGHMPCAIYHQGHDIFMGERCRFFLNSLTTSVAVWGDEQCPGISLRWLRSRFNEPSAGKAVSHKSHFHVLGSKKQEEGFRMDASDFPPLG